MLFRNNYFEENVSIFFFPGNFFRKIVPKQFFFMNNFMRKLRTTDKTIYFLLFFQHAIFILGAIALHTVVASLLLQPIKWHSKRPKKAVHEPKDSEGEWINWNNYVLNQLDLSHYPVTDAGQIANVKNLKSDSVITETFQRKRTISVSSLDGDPRSDLQRLEIKEETKKTQVICVRRDSGN